MKSCYPRTSARSGSLRSFSTLRRRKQCSAGTRTRVKEQELHNLGLELQLVVAEAGSEFAGRTVDEIESQAGPAFFIVAIDRPTSAMIARPNGATRIETGDGVVTIGRAYRAEALRGFQPADG